MKLVTLYLLAYGMILMAGYLTITAHSRAVRAEALERATRVSFESYLRTRGHIDALYTCRVK